MGFYLAATAAMVEMILNCNFANAMVTTGKKQEKT